MPDVEERLEGVERRLNSVDGAIRELRDEVGGLRDEVGRLRELPDELAGLRGEVHGLRLVVETHGSEIARLGEVLGHHGEQLEQISAALAPLRNIEQFISLVAHDHEKRITALEKRSGDRP